MTDTKREDYTWDMASKDLALMTMLTLRDAMRWTTWAKDLGTHPYDALPYLIKIVNSLPDPRVGVAFHTYMDLLINLREES